MIAQLTVVRGTLTEFPLAERVRGGWQNGVTHYPDSTVTRVIPLTVITHDEACEAEFVVGAAAYTDCGCEDRRLAMRDARIRAQALAVAEVIAESEGPSNPERDWTEYARGSAATVQRIRDRIRAEVTK